MRRLACSLLIAVMAGAAPAAAQIFDPLAGLGPSRPSATTALDKFSVRTILSHKTVEPGGSLHVAVEITVADDYWVYGPAAGGKIVQAQDLKIVAATTPLEVAPVLFVRAGEKVTVFADGTSDTHNVYEGRAYAFVPVKVPPGAEVGRYPISLTITGQVCAAEVCLQLETRVAAEVEVGESAAPSDDWTDEVRSALTRSRTADEWRSAGAAGSRVMVWGEVSRTTLGWLALSVLAGLTINILPCVLPVIPLRLLALLNQAGSSRRRFVTLGLAFAGGIFLFFVGTALANVLLRAVFQYRLAWADFYRHTPLVIGMSLLLVALAANMLGAFTVTVPGRVASAEAGQGHLGAVGMGLLMAILATPCSAALIAAAFTWAQVQPLWLGTVSILLMGVGMAAPHVALAGMPGIVSKIPKAGRWTELFKQSVGFVFLGIAVWLLGTRIEMVYMRWVLVYAVVLAFCLWVWGSWVRFDSAAWKKWSVRGAAAAVAVAAGFWMLTPAAPPLVEMAPFDAAKIARARAAGRTVLVKFTAAGCVECVVVEKKIYEDREVADELARRGVAPFVGDVTDKAMPAGEMLYEQLGQAGPPITAILPPGGGVPIVLRGVFSKSDLFESLDQAAGAPPR